MFRTLTYFIGNTLMLLILSQLLPNFEINSLSSAALFVFLLTLLNWTVVPVIKFFTFPINWITLGLFFSLLNILVIWFVASNLQGAGVEFLGSGFEKFITSVIISVSLSVIQMVIGKKY
jgi:putative membrane protein